MNATAWCAAAAVICVSASSRAGASDSIVASGQWIDFDAATPHGSAEGLDWIHQDSRHQLIGLGITHERFANARLDFARVMGVLNLTARETLSATLESGPGADTHARYTFARVTVETVRSMASGLQMGGGGQYVEADGAQTLLLRLETIWSPLTTLYLRAQLDQSIEGNLPTRLASVRADYVRRVQLYGGASVGRGAQSVVDFGSVQYASFTDGFIGIAVPFSRCMLGLTWDRLALGSLSRRTATLTVTVPIP